MNEIEIKAKWEKVFVICGETWEDYLAIRRAEQEELQNIKRTHEAKPKSWFDKARIQIRRITLNKT